MRQNSYLLIITLLLTTHLALAKPVSLVKLDGQTMSFDSLKGKWVFINYWANWCQPCLDEIKNLNQFYQTNHNKVALFAVNFDALPVAKQAKLTKRLGLKYPSLAQDPGPQLGLESVVSVPATFIFNPRGQLVDTLYGGQTVKSLSKALALQVANLH